MTWLERYCEALNRAAYELVKAAVIRPETTIYIEHEAPFDQYTSDLGIRFKFGRRDGGV